MFKENLRMDNDRVKSPSLKCIEDHSKNSDRSVSGVSFRKKFKVESSSKILSCRHINQQFSQLKVANRNTISGLNYEISQLQTKMKKKEKTYARKFNLLGRKIKREDEKTEELMAEIIMFQKELNEINGTLETLKAEESNVLGLKSQNLKKRELSSKISRSKTPLKKFKKPGTKYFRKNRLHAMN